MNNQNDCKAAVLDRSPGLAAAMANYPVRGGQQIHPSSFSGCCASKWTSLFAAAGLENQAPRPLADRLRPHKLGDVVGQDHLLGPMVRSTRMLDAGRSAR